MDAFYWSFSTSTWNPYPQGKKLTARFSAPKVG